MIKSNNFQYENRDRLSRELKAIQHPADQILVQVFSGVQDTAVIQACLETIKDALPGASIIGVTTAGEIVDGKSLDGTININVTRFEHTKVKSVLIEENSDLALAGKTIGERLKTDRLKAVIVLGCGIKDGHTINAQAMLSALQKEIPDVIIAGGQAGDNGAGVITYAFTQDGMTSKGMAAASLSSDVLSVKNTYNLSWIPIGKKMTITKAEGSRVYTIDNMPPYEIYKHYLGEEVADGLPLSAADFPLIIERDGMVQAIHATGVNTDGSFNFIHNFRPGEQMRFGYCHAGLLAIGANETYEVLSTQEVQAAFVYSCVSRKWVLGTDITVELSPIADLGCSAGFYAYGEYFYHTNKEALFLGQTMTVIALSETAEATDLQESDRDYGASETRQFRTLRVLHRLVEKSATEIEAMNMELASLVHRDSLTGLYNRRRFDEKLRFEVKRHLHSKRAISMIMFDIDYFKNYNDHYGHVAGDDCLRGLGQIIQNIDMNASDIRARYGGEEFAIIMPDSDSKRACALADELRAGIESLKIEHAKSGVSAYVTASFGVITAYIEKDIDPEEITRACDKLLYDAKEKGRNQSVCAEVTFA